MKKPVLCIFAHPDDEAFGPGGTIAKFTKERDVYIVCATNGEAGQGDYKNLGSVRKKELRASAKLLGFKNVYFLGFKDGSLSNNLYHKLASNISDYIEKLKPEILLTFDINGVSGHIDHIVTALATTYAFEHQKIAKKLMYFCFHESHGKYFKNIHFDYFVHIPPGYKDSQIDKIVDVSGVWNKRCEAVQIHQSQKSDSEFVSKMLNSLPKKEYFRIKNSNQMLG